MKKQIKYSLSLVAIVALIGYSCEKFSGDDDFITGSWRCIEESGSGNKQYTVAIDRTEIDTTMFKILNFHNLGFETETFFKLKDTVATIIGTMDGSYNISGKGYVKKDYSSIRWMYTISGGGINSGYVEAYFFRK